MKTSDLLLWGIALYLLSQYRKPQYVPTDTGITWYDFCIDYSGGFYRNPNPGQPCPLS